MLNNDSENAMDAAGTYRDHVTGPEHDANKTGTGTNAVGDIDYPPRNPRNVGRGENSETSCVGGKNTETGKKTGR